MKPSDIPIPHIFRQDNKDHWYLIPEHKKLEFADLLYKTQDIKKFDIAFKKYAVSSPLSVKVYPI